MIVLRNGVHCEYFAASGALAFDGRGWPWEWPLRWLGLLDPACFTIVIKTLTEAPRRGNLRWWHPLRCVRCLPDGAVNAVGLTNPGIDWWCRQIGPRIATFPYRLVGSIHAATPAALAGMAQRMVEFPLAALELNVSCPNTAEKGLHETAQTVQLVEAVAKVCRLPLLLKLGVTHDYCEVARQTHGMIDAIAINSVPWALCFPHRPSPLASFGGGAVSGRIIQSHTWAMVRALSAASPTPVIGPSVWRYADLAAVRACGAKAVSFGSLFLRHPCRPTAFVRRECNAPA